MCVLAKNHSATHTAFFFFSAWLPDSALKSTIYALYSPGWFRRLQGLSLSDSAASGMASWTKATAWVPTCVIWIKVSIYVSAPVMHLALSCTSCINFLFVWVQSVPHPASVTSSAPPLDTRGSLARLPEMYSLSSTLGHSVDSGTTAGVGWWCPLSLLQSLKLPGFTATP